MLTVSELSTIEKAGTREDTVGLLALGLTQLSFMFSLRVYAHHMPMRAEIFLRRFKSTEERLPRYIQDTFEVLLLVRVQTCHRPACARNHHDFSHHLLRSTLQVRFTLQPERLEDSVRPTAGLTQRRLTAKQLHSQLQGPSL